MTTRSVPLCEACYLHPAEVLIAVDGDVITHQPWCMDCAAPVVAAYMGEIVEVLDDDYR